MKFLNKLLTAILLLILVCIYIAPVSAQVRMEWANDQKSVLLSPDYDNDSSETYTPGFETRKWVVFNPSTTTDMYADVDPATTTTTNYVFIPRSTSYLYSKVEIPVKGLTIRVRQKRTTAVNCRVTAYR